MGEEQHASAAEPVAGRATEHEEKDAAEMIQRNYRGYRERRQLKGHELSASARWAEAIRDAQWRNATRPRSRSQKAESNQSASASGQLDKATSNAARENWKRVGEIARRAGADDPEDASTTDDEILPEDKAARRRKKVEARNEREKTAKMMDLQYFLEMVDQKHRYGSNLRTYHAEWKKADTHENFFYWLDEGDGKDFEHPTRSRERLEKEQVRYLSREERLQYLVEVDKEGRLVWARNGERINTNVEFKDSINGIVPKDDPAPTFGPYGKIIYPDTTDDSKKERSSTSSSSSDDSSDEEHSDVEGEHYVNEELDNAKGIEKIKYVSAAAVLNHLLRGSVKPNTWIFVADTSFRLYIGIKQSGAFQHSSFLHGARIASAGLIKIKNGQLRRLSPLSGHYRPPTKNFRSFVHALQDNGVDMSRVSISRSYAILVGLEAYVKTRRKFKHGLEHVKNAETKVMHPEEYKRRKEAELDKSKSAQRERQLLAHKAEKEEALKREQSWHRRMWRRLGRSTPELVGDELTRKQREDAKNQKKKKALSKSGLDVESGIPPDGKREKPVEASDNPAR